MRAPSSPVPPEVRLETATHVGVVDVQSVLALVRAAVEVDGRRPVSEHSELRLRRGGEEPARQVLARAGRDLVGYADLDPGAGGGAAVAELVVHPARRRQGIGAALLAAVEAAAPGGLVRVWAHGNHPAAKALAAASGYEPVRSLCLMRRELSAPLPEYEVPAGVTLRPFRPGADDEAWLGVNARAFASHPEQGQMTRRDLSERMAEPWFDPQGFLVAEDAATGEVLGFHWTKVHSDGPRPAGEVYVVGVDPAAQGRRLGSVLTLAGLHHLRSAGLDEVFLYVEGDNEPALAVYSRLGFEQADVDVLYERRR